MRTGVFYTAQNSGSHFNRSIIGASLYAKMHSILGCKNQQKIRFSDLENSDRIIAEADLCSALH
jgi:hypothetical protein